MKIALLLLCCILFLALAILALPQHQAAAAQSPYITSEALADAMSSHGIEAANSSAGTADFESTAYRPEPGGR